MQPPPNLPNSAERKVSGRELLRVVVAVGVGSPGCQNSCGSNQWMARMGAQRFDIGIPPGTISCDGTCIGPAHRHDPTSLIVDVTAGPTARRCHARYWSA